MINRQTASGWIITLAVLVCSRPLPAGGEGVWRPLAPMPTARQEISTAVLNGLVYVIGGYNTAGQSTNVVEVYDPTTDLWSTAAPLPIVTDHNASAVAAGILFTFGGLSTRVFAYYPEKDLWYEAASMNYRHGGTPAVGVIDDLIYVAGGNGPGMAGNEVEVYDPFQDTWTVLSPMNIPRNHTAGGAIDGKLYVAGGRGHPEAASALEVYDPAADAWTMLAPLPTGRSGIGSGVVNNQLYIFGGEIPGVFAEVELYNPAEDAWRRLADMPTPRHGLFGAVIDNAIYLPGGAIVQGFGASDVNEVFVVPAPQN